MHTEFQNLMYIILASMSGVFVYINKMVVFEKTKHETSNENSGPDDFTIKGREMYEYTGLYRMVGT